MTWLVLYSVFFSLVLIPLPYHPQSLPPIHTPVPRHRDEGRGGPTPQETVEVVRSRRSARRCQAGLLAVGCLPMGWTIEIPAGVVE